VHRTMSCFAFITQQCQQRHYVFMSLVYLSAAFVRLSVRSLICSSGQIFVLRYLTNALNNFDKTDREYSIGPTADLIRFCLSKVKIMAGHRDSKVICLTCFLVCWASFMEQSSCRTALCIR